MADLSSQGGVDTSDTPLPTRGTPAASSSAPLATTDPTAAFQSNYESAKTGFLKSYKDQMAAEGSLNREGIARDERLAQRQEKMLDAEGATIEELKHGAWNAQEEMGKRETSLWEQFGSPAFLVAMMGSAFSAMPMNSALNAGGAAIHAMNQGKMDDYQRAFDAWKANTNIVLKRADLEHQEYEDIDHLRHTDLAAWRAKALAVATRFNDQRAIALINEDMYPELLEARDAIYQSAEKMRVVKDDLEERNNKVQWITAKLKEEGKEHDVIRHQELSNEYDAAKADAKYGGVGHGAPTKEKEIADLKRKWKKENPKEEGESDFNYEKRAEQAAGQVATQARTTAGASTLSETAARIKAEQAWDGNYTGAFQGMARNSANMALIANEIARIGEEKGLAPEETAKHLDQAIAAFAGGKAGATTVARTAAAIVSAADRARYAIPRVEQTVGAVDLTKYSDINKLLLDAKQRTGDPNVVRFGIALQTLISNYAQVISNGRGITTDAARHEAMEILQKNWSPGQFSAGLDQLRKEIASEMRGAFESMKDWETQQVPDIENETSTSGYVKGRIYNGYRYKGGDPTDKNNYEKP